MNDIRQRFRWLAPVAVIAGAAIPLGATAAEAALPAVSIDYMGSATGVAYEHEPIAFALTRTGDARDALTVRVEVEESGDVVAAAGEGIQAVTFEAGDAMATFEPAITDDSEDEPHSSVRVSLEVGPGAAYLAGSPDTATLQVRDNDGILVEFSLAPLDHAVNEGESARFELVGTTVDDGTFTSTGDLARVIGPESIEFEWVTIYIGEAGIPDDFRGFIELFHLRPEDFEPAENGLATHVTLREIPIVDDGVMENDERFIARLALSSRFENLMRFAGREPVEGISHPLSGPRFLAAVVTVRGNSGDLRLVNGNTGHEGRLEMFHDGRWGTVCDDYWTDDESGVACRQLGYPGAESNTGRFLRAHFGQGTGPIWLDNVLCEGHEGRLIDCPRISEGKAVGGHNCTHEEDVGIRCLLTEPACRQSATRRRDGNTGGCSG